MTPAKSNLAGTLFPSPGNPGEGEGGGLLRRISAHPEIKNGPPPPLPRITGGGEDNERSPLTRPLFPTVQITPSNCQHPHSSCRTSAMPRHAVATERPAAPRI